jgi:PAS domain S-box-containing protein
MVKKSNDFHKAGKAASKNDNIASRKQTEEALIASRLQLSDAMELAHIVYWEADLTTGDFIFNDPFYAFYGTTAEREGGYRMMREEYGKRFLYPDDLWMFAQVAEKRRLNKEREFLCDVEHRIVRRDGKVRHILARIRVIKDADGRVIKYYGANQDITERKLAEEEREKLILRLQEAYAKVKTLSGLLPICSSCKKIRNDKGYWEQMEVYIRDHSEADFSHGICPECAEKLYPEYYKKI